MADWDNYEEGGMIDSEEQKIEVVNRKVLPVIFLIDVSVSMSGKKLDIVNNSVESIIHHMEKMNNADIDIKYGVLTFGRECKWITGNELKVCDSNWNVLQADSGEECACFNTACSELKEKLSGKHGLFNFATGNYSPVIILLTDGYANDGDADGKDGIEELKKNKYFNSSYRLAITIGDKANQQLCENFTGDKELVFTVYNEKALRGLLYAVINGSICVGDSGPYDSSDDMSKKKSGYYIDDSFTNYDEKVNICKCQYEKTSQNEALNTIYKIEYKSNDVLSVKNSSEFEQEVSVHLKPGETLQVTHPIGARLFYKSNSVNVSNDSGFFERFKSQKDWDVWD